MIWKNDITRRLAVMIMCLGLVLGLDGCRHQPKVVTPLRPALVPVPLEEVPRPENEPMVEVLPVRMPPVPIAAAATRLPREHKKPVVATKAAPPPEEAPSPEPVAEATGLGSLTTTGTTTDPQIKQDAADLIASNDKRLSALPIQKADEQKSQISTVKNFQKQAQEALASGDAEGAKTLATKAKLLLDDLEK